MKLIKEIRNAILLVASKRSVIKKRKRIREISEPYRMPVSV
jgi:hypothetical protein